VTFIPYVSIPSEFHRKARELLHGLRVIRVDPTAEEPRYNPLREEEWERFMVHTIFRRQLALTLYDAARGKITVSAAPRRLTLRERLTGWTK
jgi:hypothetical protein